MSKFRKNITTLLSCGSSLIPFSIWKKASDFITILPFYHVISDEYLPHIQHLYPVKNVNSFIEDLDFLLKHFEAIDLQTFRKHQKEGTQPVKHSFLLTFDDGLREFYEVIAPILLKKGIPSVCFLNSAFVDNKDLFFRYKVSLLIEEVSNDSDKSGVLQDRLRIQNVKNELLRLTYDDIGKIDEMALAINLDFKKFLKEKSPYLTSEQIKSLIGQGFSFGGHSVDHPEYRFVGIEEQIRQTKDSVDFVQNNFKTTERVFSFPFTDYQVHETFYKRIMDEKIAEFTFGSAGLKHDPTEINFQRIPMEVEDLAARRILSAEYLYYLLKKPLGKNSISRNG